MWKQCIAILLIGGCLLGISVAPSLGQTPISEKEVNLFSLWVKLSLIGYNQSEIESALSYVDQNQLAKVKQRLRLKVIKNLRRMGLENDIEMSTTEQELGQIKDKIQTEIRFAGLENDQHLHVLIQHRFGISLRNI